METTKIYVVSKHSCRSMWSYPEIVGAFFSKVDAEFFVYTVKKAESKCEPSYFYSSDIYKVSEVNVGSSDKNSKIFKEFAKERLKEIDETMSLKEKCSSEDMAEITKLEAEKEFYAKVV